MSCSNVHKKNFLLFSKYNLLRVFFFTQISYHHLGFIIAKIRMLFYYGNSRELWFFFILKVLNGNQCGSCLPCLKIMLFNFKSCGYQPNPKKKSPDFKIFIIYLYNKKCCVGFPPKVWEGVFETVT